jgi:plasmid stabilization system protein ParE
MKEYRVQITDAALADMEDLYQYIAIQLEAPQYAMKQYNRIADAVLRLNSRPERYELCDAEPWRSRGLHHMNIENYKVFFTIRDDTVIIMDILYAAEDLEPRLPDR